MDILDLVCSGCNKTASVEQSLVGKSHMRCPGKGFWMHQLNRKVISYVYCPHGTLRDKCPIHALTVYIFKGEGIGTFYIDADSLPQAIEEFDDYLNLHDDKWHVDSTDNPLKLVLMFKGHFCCFVDIERNT